MGILKGCWTNSVSDQWGFGVMGCRSNELCVYYVVRYVVSSIEGVG